MSNPEKQKTEPVPDPLSETKKPSMQWKKLYLLVAIALALEIIFFAFVTYLYR